jgi:hypothetical protein
MPPAAKRYRTARYSRRQRKNAEQQAYSATAERNVTLPRAGEAACLGLGPIARGDPEREFVVADADVVAIVESGGRADPLVLHVHAVR